MRSKFPSSADRSSFLFQLTASYYSVKMAPSVLKAAALALRAVSIICPSQPTCPEDDGCSYQAPDGTDLTFSCAESSVVSRDVEISARAVSVTCPTLPTCPQNDQCTFTANEVSFQIDCATDFYGGDLQLARVCRLQKLAYSYI